MRRNIRRIRVVGWPPDYRPNAGIFDAASRPPARIGRSKSSSMPRDYVISKRGRLCRQVRISASTRFTVRPWRRFGCRGEARDCTAQADDADQAAANKDRGHRTPMMEGRAFTWATMSIAIPDGIIIRHFDEPIQLVRWLKANAFDVDGAIDFLVEK
jgi:hypothetical protein